MECPTCRRGEVSAHAQFCGQCRQPVASPTCLCCRTVPLESLPSPTPSEIAFYRCPQCQRQFAEKPGQAPTERWPGPLSLVLYGVIFSPRPQEEADRIATGFRARRSPAELAEVVQEIRAELAQPTQNVRDILDCVAAERDLREFLARVADQLTG